MGDVYMVNGKILSGLPNHAKDIEFDNTDSPLSSTNCEDAIKEVNSNLSYDYDSPSANAVYITVNDSYQAPVDGYFSIVINYATAGSYEVKFSDKNDVTIGYIRGEKVANTPSVEDTVYIKKGVRMSVLAGSATGGYFRPSIGV